MQEQSGGSALKQTSADQWDFGRFDHAANCGSIVAGSTTRRSTDHQQQQNEEGTKGCENIGNHRVSVSGLLASLLSLVNFSFFLRHYRKLFDLAVTFVYLSRELRYIEIHCVKLHLQRITLRLRTSYKCTTTRALVVMIFPIFIKIFDPAFLYLDVLEYFL